MFYLIIKTLLTAIIVVVVSEISKRSSLLGGLIISIPLTTFLALIWLYWETHNINKIIDLTNSTLFMIIPSLSFFIFLPFFLKINYSFILSMALSVLLTSFCYWLFFILIQKFGHPGF